MMMTDSLLEKLQKISSEMSSHNDNIYALKTEELHSKLTAGQLTIALCGHFSAGKSTLLNTLCGAKLLPSSPIPTSANVVTISYGETSVAYVEISTANGVRYDEVPVDQLDSYCKDGESYISVKLQYPSELLKSGITLLDTPGIDSTDSAHKLATESALHLADVVFYVMDYNHVQSEINFTFAKELREWGKPLYFIVNQIDKHREEELSFEQYQQSVADSFNAWNLEPAGILYLSLREPNHRYHQWASLNILISELKKMQAQLTSYSVWSSLAYITNLFIEEQEQKLEPQKQQWLELIGGVEQLTSAISKKEELEQKLAALREQVEQYPIQLRKDVDQLLDNANIIPAVVRDLAHDCLAVHKPGYRAGLFASKQKTQAVQTEKLQAFYLEIKKLTEANIVWHLQTLLREAGDAVQYDSKLLPQSLEKLSEAEFNEQFLLDCINYGAVFGNEYTMTYCKDISAKIKSNYRKAALDIIDLLSKHNAELANIAIQEDEALLEQLRSEMVFVEQYNELEQQQKQYRQKLEQTLLPKYNAPDLPKPKLIDSNKSEELISFVEQKQSLHLGKVTSQSYSDQIKAAFDANDRDEIVTKMLQAADQLTKLEGLEQFVAQLRQKANRLDDQKFSISLFGAFSAGKSSLANALIGERVLPVSPNPTTAAINSLLPPTDEHPHDTATIYMKTEQLMREDIIYSLSLLGYELTDSQRTNIDQLFNIIDRITPEAIHSGGRAHYSFIKAARIGWEEQQQWLGKQRDVDRSLYQAYVAEEHRSCFVSEIKFYYDCELTRKGIVLVDTPGADSVNARHTGVAFNYIKNTDAILFVTYYNHAFSHADSQFLDQLGRVKDQFELDKMFFIVNAADLASEEAELLEVMNHVEHNLQKHGIVAPRMYPISSLQAIEGKQLNDEALIGASGLASFEQAFYHFIHNELAMLAMQSARNEYEHIVRIVTSLLHNAKAAKQDAAAQISKINLTLQTIQNKGAQEALEPLSPAVKQEVEELLYYIVQRLTFRFGDFYNYAFNPAVLKDDGRSLSQATWTAWLELQRSIALELQQELLATTLRVEKAIKASLAKQVSTIFEYAQSQLEGYEQIPLTDIPSVAPAQLNDWVLPELTQKWFSGRIKSPKQFFEGDGKAKLRKTLEELIFPSIEDWMKTVLSAWMLHYEQEWSRLLSLQTLEATASVQQYGKQQLRLLEDESYVHKLEEAVKLL